MTEAANNLFLFLSTHQSCRILFNSLIKAKNPLIDPEEIIYDFKERLKVSSCSFIYCANCKCGVPLDKPTIIDNNFKLPKQKDITCNKCGILNKINPNDYFPVYDFFVNDVVKLLYFGNNFKIFLVTNSIECIYCRDYSFIADIRNVDLICEKCNHVCNVRPIFIFIPEIGEIKEESQGYWLEWYIGRLLSKNNPINGREIINKKDNEIRFDADCIIERNGKLFILECKDTKDIGNTISNLHLLEPVVDKWFLVHTEKFKDERKHFRAIENILGEKFIDVPSKDIEKIFSIISKY